MGLAERAHNGPACAGVRPSVVAGVFAHAGGLAFLASLLWFLYCYLVRFGSPVPPGPAAAAVLADVVLFSAFALHHSVMARTPVKRWLHARVAGWTERALYTWIASLLFLAVCTLWQPIPGVLYRLDGVWAVPGYVAQLAGLLITIRASSAIDVLDLAGIRPWSQARAGRPSLHVPLRTRGPFGFVRHPLYFSWALVVFGSPLMTATRAAFAVISTLYLAIAIPWEERDLVKTFGGEYEAYRRRVRWRMIPFVY